MSVSRLHIVATPIGNLEDITLRAIRVLKEADLILAEDTRVAKKLLNKFDISSRVERFDANVERTKTENIISRLSEGQKVALISDAGTPGISDPGAFLVSKVREELPDCKIEPIPGPSALATALSVSGITSPEFVFLGFPPHKKGRKSFFESLGSEERAVVIYESTHRILKTIEEIAGLYPKRKIGIFRELTKMHEEHVVGLPSEVLSVLRESPKKVKGEFVVVLYPL